MTGESVSVARYAVYGVSFLLDLPKVATILPLAKKALVPARSSRATRHRWRRDG